MNETNRHRHKKRTLYLNAALKVHLIQESPTAAFSAIIKFIIKNHSGDRALSSFFTKNIHPPNMSQDYAGEDLCLLAKRAERDLNSREVKTGHERSDTCT